MQVFIVSEDFKNFTVYSLKIQKGRQGKCVSRSIFGFYQQQQPQKTSNFDLFIARFVCRFQENYGFNSGGKSK